MNYEKIYQYRFQNIDQAAREKVWVKIAQFLHRFMGQPQIVLDPAAGRCEFLNHVPAKEKWGVDLNDFINRYKGPEVKTKVGDFFTVDLPQNYFDAIFMSNFLEHLAGPEQVATLFRRVNQLLKPGGVVCIMGPNFKYCAKEYYDCADHLLPLTHLSVEELLYSESFVIDQSHPKFLPFSFRGILPPSPLLTEIYLSCPPAWRILGKQFLISARRAR
ncbi:MAG: methyltransferase type 11 [Bdellovibrionales bacterium GWA2_49_15]|nr:MAG: methyltransferase type 11 [Bdellovibrionales bacterium GWA2_49_15]HAZ14440.1 methyltransferase type 11 [Bdellovibrionales bacterium]